MEIEDPILKTKHGNLAGAYARGITTRDYFADLLDTAREESIINALQFDVDVTRWRLRNKVEFVLEFFRYQSKRQPFDTVV